MAWNGSGSFVRTNGTYSGTSVWTSDRDASVKITASRHDTHDQDLAAGINACLAKNGENAMTGDLNMGGNDVTNAVAGTFSGAVTASTVSDATGNVRAGRKNLLINGGMDVWQRGTSQTSSGFGSVDRWRCGHSGSTKTVTQFVMGLSALPVTESGLKYAVQTDVVSVAGSTNYVAMWEKIEGSRTAAGKSVTVSFYAKADASRQVALELVQNFGTGGSPSSEVTGIGAQKFSVTTDWQRFSATISVPSVTSKTLGSNDNGYLQVTFWFDAGSSYNSRTATLGHQSGSFFVTGVQVEIGSAATDYEKRPLAEIISACQRYYETGRFVNSGYQAGGNDISSMIYYNAFKRAAPTLTVSDDSSTGTTGSFSVSESNQQSGMVLATKNVSSGAYYWRMNWTSDAEL